MGLFPHHIKHLTLLFLPLFLQDFLSLSFLFILEAHWNLCYDQDHLLCTHLFPLVLVFLLSLYLLPLDLDLSLSPSPEIRISIKGWLDQPPQPALVSISTTSLGNTGSGTLLAHSCIRFGPLPRPVLCSIAFRLQFRLPPLAAGLFIPSYYSK